MVEKKRKRIMTPGSAPSPSAATLRRASAPATDAPSPKKETAAAPEAKPAAKPENKSAPSPAPAARQADSKPPARRADTGAERRSGPANRGGGGQQRRGGDKPNMLRTLSNEEYERRLQALKQAKKDDEIRKKREAAEAAKRAERDAKRKAEEDAARVAAEAAEREAAERAAADKARAEQEAAEKARDEAKKVEQASKAAAAPAAAPAPQRPGREDEETGRGRRGAPAAPPKKQAGPRNRGDDRRRSGKLTIAQATGDAEGGRQRSMAAMRRRQERERRKMMGTAEREKVFRDVTIPDTITVQELANRMTERVGDVIKALMKNGIMATQNQTIDQDTAELIVEEFGHTVTRVSEADVEDAIEAIEDSDKDLQPRAPIITIMGHVDHGKTSLLDKLRDANVVAGEAGGITQHIGAYQIESEGGQKLTFLDTPGHAAFTSMRARGANVTDIVILVVAADDSVMPQTAEAIQHAKAAKVPMIVAINKIDREGADPNKVRTELLQHEVIVEEMSGDVLDVEVSALTGQGLDDLVENIALQSELLELKANPNRPAEGAVIEAKLDVGRGPVATVLVQRGTLRTGDIFVVGEQWGKVRALINDKGERVTEAGPSVPVEVLGLNGTPEAGDVLNVVEDETKAREISEYRQRKTREKAAASGGAVASLDQLLAQAKADENVAKLPVVVKSDVQGSAEAITQALEKIGNDEVSIQVLLSSVGAITESDVNLAEASKAPIIGFNVRANAPAREAANQKGVEIRYYSVIYDLVDDVKAAASGLRQTEVPKFLEPPYLLPTKKGNRPFAIWVIDCITNLPPISRGNKHLVVAVCC
ncbi:MAG: translation initiation factor IF-2, partial [Pseudomonadota bacterium]